MELVAVGDISLGDSWQGVGGGVHSLFERVRHVNRAYPFEYATSLFRGAGIIFGNLETVLSHRGLVRWKASSVEMRGHPDAAERLAAAGFTALNVANNHMMQHGTGAFFETVESLRRHGMGVVGLASAAHRECVPQTLCANGVSATVLGFAFEEDKYCQGRVAYAFGPDCDIPRQVAAAKKCTDLVICSVHWGVEFVGHPSLAEEELGRRLVDAGADLVIGHHPHVVRRVERYGRGLIAYSLGNFVFDMLWNPRLRTGLVLRVLFSRNGVEHYETELVWIGDDYQPRLLAGEEREAATSAFNALQQRPEWIAQEEQYALHYQKLVANNRYESYGHFLRNMKNRPLTYTVQTVLRTARRKAVGVFSSDRTHLSGRD